MAEITKRQTLAGSLFPKEIGLQHLEHEGGTTGDCSITADESMSFGALRVSSRASLTSFCFAQTHRFMSKVSFDDHEIK